MKKKSFVINIISFMLIALFVAGSCFAETKKVLVLQIIEENWDDLEFSLPKYLIGDKGGPKLITKKEAIRPFGDFKKDIKAKNEKIIKNIKQSFKNSISKGNISKNAGVYVRHEIEYYGKTYQLKEDETFMKDAFRFDSVYFEYSYEKVPKKISVLTDPTNDPVKWLFLRKYKYIRLLDDIFITSANEKGDLKIKYAGRDYNLNVTSILELPSDEKILTKKEMLEFKTNYEEKWGFKVESLGTGGIRSSKESFHFITKVTLVNYGYMEIETE